MLSRDYLRESADEYRQILKHRGTEVELDRFLELDRERRAILKNVEALKNQRNLASAEIAELKKNKQDASQQIEAMKKVGEDIKALDQRLAVIEEALHQLEMTFPNVFDPSVPVGHDETANRVERTWGEAPDFDFVPRPHWEVGERLGILDFERAAKISGTRFSILLGPGARLERALIWFMLDLHTREHGYFEVWPPAIVNADSLRGTGQLPKFAGDQFRIEADRDLYLAPTAEVQVTNLHRDEILAADKLPLSYTAYTPCFRSEAGSWGKDTRGLIRQHQFDKVELVKFTLPGQSPEEHEKLTANAEEVLRRLGLHYRVVTLSSGDMGFAAMKTYDLEVWLPGQNTYREISSCSNFGEFQARRAAIRFKGDGKKIGYVHTLNGSGLAVGRTLVAILETFQRADGSVEIPPALRPYFGANEIAPD